VDIAVLTIAKPAHQFEHTAGWRLSHDRLVLPHIISTHSTEPSLPTRLQNRGVNFIELTGKRHHHCNQVKFDASIRNAKGDGGNFKGSLFARLLHFGPDGVANVGRDRRVGRSNQISSDTRLEQSFKEIHIFDCPVGSIGFKSIYVEFPDVRVQFIC